MTIEKVKISSLRPDPKNARDHNKKNLAAIQGSLDKFGQQKPIIIDHKGIIRAGNGTYQAALALGWTEILVVKTELKGRDLKAFGIADNRTAELAEWDAEELAEQLQDLEDFDLESIGFDDDDIEKMLKEAESDADPEADGTGASGSPDEKTSGTFAVYTECEGEADQKKVLELLAERGLSPRGLISAMPRRFTPPLQPQHSLGENGAARAGSMEIVRTTKIAQSARLAQLAGMFDLPPAEEHTEKWSVNIAFPSRWNIGVIVGPSGSGKSTIARELFGDCMIEDIIHKTGSRRDAEAAETDAETHPTVERPLSDSQIKNSTNENLAKQENNPNVENDSVSVSAISASQVYSRAVNHSAIVDLFPDSLSITEITDLLCRVGFSSPPDWRKPFHVLSTGQKFRVELALTLAAACIDRQPKVVDEFTSVVDRTVAKIGSAAVAKAVRQYGLQFVAVSCHYDIIPWLEPDWVYDVSTRKLTKNA